jgi:ribonuclease HIII
MLRKFEEVKICVTHGGCQPDDGGLFSRTMVAQSTVTLKCDLSDAPGFESLLALAGFEMSEVPHAFWRAKGDQCTATFYRSGKLVLQGAMAESWAAHLSPEHEIQSDAAGEMHQSVDDALASRFDAALAKHPSPAPSRWVGIDETGKGDYFGPLVTVAAAVERDMVPLLAELGVGDSKRISDKKIRKMVGDLKACCRFSKVVIGPERYNQIYAQVGNLNRLLAWAHARALEDVLEKAPDCTYGLSDQFAKNTRLIESRLQERGRKIVFEQRTKAEEDPAVAVASMLARDEFLWQMADLEKMAGRSLPKGAGPPVLAAAREIAHGSDPSLLERVAKLHFRTTQQIGL